MTIADSALAGVARLAHEAGVDHVAIEAASLATRIAEGRFYVACVGQFKRGKSTLLNALVGEPVLPTGVVPVTTVVTVLRYGAPAARVQFVDGRWHAIPLPEIASYVTEEQNPGNRKGVLAVEAFMPSALLAAGMCLVDTPGLGSTILENTAATQRFVPHVDAALIVLGADPPISADELALVAQLAEQRVEHLLFVLNKADRLPDAERREARAFTERVLATHLGKPVDPVFEVAAITAGGTSEARYDWQPFRATLERLAHDAGSDLVRAAERRGVDLFAERLLRAISEDRAALVRPLADSERRVAVLKRCAADAERSLRELGHLLRAEEGRLDEALSTRQREFLGRAIPAARAELREAIAVVRDERGAALRDRATRTAQDVFRRHLERWRAEEQPAAENAYTEAVQRFVALGEEFLERLANSGDPALTTLPQRVTPHAGLRTRSRLYYTEMLTLTARSPLTRVLDGIRPRERRHRSVERDAGDYLERLLTTNAARLTNDLRDRIRDSRERLEIELRGYLRDLYRAAEQALDRARERRAAGDAAMRSQLDRLDVLAAEVTAVRNRAKGGGDGNDRVDSRA